MALINFMDTLCLQHVYLHTAFSLSKQQYILHLVGNYDYTVPQSDRYSEAQLHKQVFHILTMDSTLKIVET